MSHTLTLILGGARSGKSSYAEKLAGEQGANVLYVATAQAWDEEMAERIARHKADRPDHWQTLEAQQEVGHAIQETLISSFDVVLIDCLTLLATNVILPIPEPISDGDATAAVMHEVDRLLEAYQQSNCHWLIVSNEVGLGVVPPYPLGRVYRDALGRANQRLAAAADRVLFMVAGLPMVVK
ncbi:MAG: bifunctional adenosylcobinamide kinase/adenosylcobinamide-phosphate guanylyltransferase [Caldilineaceae bacterium]